MSDNVWNDDIAYVFSIHRTFMQILCIWPLQKKTIFTMIQWNLILFLQLSSLIFLYMELTGSNRDASRRIDAIGFLVVMLILSMKYICVNVNGRKLTKNINSAIADWSANDKKSYKIMKKHAFKSRLCTLFMLYSAATCIFLYLTYLCVNLKDIFSQDQMVNISNGDVNIKDKPFLVPSGELGDKITNLQYTIIIFFQIVQIIVIGTMQFVMDSFYVNITLHLAGQLKVLKRKFKNFASKPDTEINYRKEFSNLINRHCKLMEFNQNIEETFNLVLLFQLVAVTLLLSLLGLRVIFILRKGDYVELTKIILLINYLFMQSAIYCFGSDFVQKGSESIFHAMFMASWFRLPATLMKDLNFAILKSSYPFRLTGGKFFYVNRETILFILKTAVSYVSVLRVALEK